MVLNRQTLFFWSNLFLWTFFELCKDTDIRLGFKIANLAILLQKYGFAYLDSWFDCKKNISTQV
jgi:hypothetical protein